MQVLGLCFLMLLPSLCLADTLVLKNGETVYGTCILGLTSPWWSVKFGQVLFKTQGGVEQSFAFEAIKELRLDGNSLFAVFGQETEARKEMIRRQTLDKLNALPAPGFGKAELGQFGQEKTPGSISPLVGTWVFESQAYQTYEHVVLTLRANGTYARILELRLYGPNSRTGGGTDQGTWTANGSVVTVSGDGYLSAKSYDLKNFAKSK